jgi:amidophosphoribosyltransferase
MCGVAFIRLKKPLEYYVEKYGAPTYGLTKLHMLMEKQLNRGQDGAGIATIKLDTPPGSRFISRYRSNASEPVKELFDRVYGKFQYLNETQPELLKNVPWLKENVSFTGELLLGHLRYGTHGGNSIERCHPFLRQNNWKNRSLIVAGNFNMTNVDELFDQLVEIGQHPKEKSDTVTVLEKIGHFLDDENERLYSEFKEQGYSKREITDLISDQKIDIQKILTRSAKDFDGGYCLAGLIGNGDAFILRDPNGIRPAYWYEDDEVIVAASERAPIQTTFNLKWEQVKEITPGHAIIVRKNGETEEVLCREPEEDLKCSFERIYFAKGNDKDIYTERKEMGIKLAPRILKSINNDFKNAVFSWIPNTAETSYFGMVKGLEQIIREDQFKKLFESGKEVKEEDLKDILSATARGEKIIQKTAKLRTFITDDTNRDDLVATSYDVTYGQIRRDQDTLVLLDDSIVRGTTLKQSILRIADRLGPKKVVIVSAAPQIRYPDCYGIDMSKLKDFIAFRAAIHLLHDRNMEYVIDEVYDRCKAQQSLPKEECKNYVKQIYEPFTDDEISKKIADLLIPNEMNAEVEIIYQTVDDLHECCPENKGDWYFTGNFPTDGGNKVVSKSFVNFYEKSDARAY